MEKHLYLSLVPEALIASQLTPEEFGAYYACGTQRKARGQSTFIQIAPGFRRRDFRINEHWSAAYHMKGASPRAPSTFPSTGSPSAFRYLHWGRFTL